MIFLLLACTLPESDYVPVRSGYHTNCNSLSCDYVDFADGYNDWYFCFWYCAKTEGYEDKMQVRIYFEQDEEGCWQEVGREVSEGSCYLW